MSLEDSLEKLDNFETVRQLYTQLAEVEGFPKAIFEYYDSRNKGFEFIKWEIEAELKNCNYDAMSFLRGENLVTRIFALQFEAETGNRFLYNLCHPLLTSICKHENNLEIDLMRGDMDETKENLGWMIEELKQFISRLGTSVDLCPLVIREGFVCLDKALTQCEKNDREMLLCSYLFLRFICPALLSPIQHGLTIGSLSPEVQRGLVNASRLLQNLANGSPLDAIQSHSIEISKFIEAERPIFIQFIQELVDEARITKVKQILRTHAKTGDFSYWDIANPSYEQKSKENLRSLLVFNNEARKVYEQLTMIELNQIRFSWKLVEGKIDQLGSLFYNRLFETTPIAKTLFEHIPLEKQAQKLLKVVAHLIRLGDMMQSNLSKANSELIVRSLWDVGGRHLRYGIEQEDLFQHLASAFIWAMGQPTILGSDFATYEHTWSKAFKMAVNITTRGWRDAKKKKDFDYKSVTRHECNIL